MKEERDNKLTAWKQRKLGQTSAAKAKQRESDDEGTVHRKSYFN